MKKQAITLLASLTLMIGFPMAAMAAEEIELDEDSHLQQVIPPAMLDETMIEYAPEPINLDEIYIGEQTPADRFVSATTPLVVALMLGSVGLVIYTLTRVERQD